MAESYQKIDGVTKQLRSFMAYRLQQHGIVFTWPPDRILVEATGFWATFPLAFQQPNYIKQIIYKMYAMHGVKIPLLSVQKKQTKYIIVLPSTALSLFLDVHLLTLYTLLSSPTNMAFCECTLYYVCSGWIQCPRPRIAGLTCSLPPLSC